MEYDRQQHLLSYSEIIVYSSAVDLLLIQFFPIVQAVPLFTE